MTKTGATTRPTRIRLPEELSGAFTGIVIGTFGAALDFAELQLFRQLPKSAVNKIVLADQRQLASFLNAQPPLRRLNRAYVASPVRSPHAHHPKYVMLVGPEEGRLFVGSGNLSIGGYAGPGECFTVYEWKSEETNSNPAPFGAVRELIDSMVEVGWVDAVTRERIRDVFKSATWVPTTGGADCMVVHNQTKSLLDQFVERVGDGDVSEVVAAAPFHDKNADAIRQIVRRLKPQRFKLLVQEGMTRLEVGAVKSALSAVPTVEIVEAAAPHPYPAVLLHAKFVLARTSDSDFLLQGSANLSRVALCESGPKGNVEIANLLHGAPKEFDTLLESLDLSLRSDGLATFAADNEWGDDQDDAAESVGPSNVTWAPPTLRGELPSSLGQYIVVRVGERDLSPLSISWETIEDVHHFTVELGEADAARLHLARYIEVIDSTGERWSVYPYHLHSLLRLSASGGRAELLQETGDLDLHDKELEDLVAELDRVLIVDGKSLWRLAHPGNHQADTDTDNGADGVGLRYEELDWTKLGALPQLHQYGSAANRTLLAPTELGLILQSLTNRFRTDAGDVSSNGSDLGDVGGLGEEPESEDPDEVDDTSDVDDEEESVSRRIAPRQRVRRLWRNFVSRFVRGLADEDFIQNVGSPVIIPSYVVFNHLCRRLRVTDLVDADFLTEAQTTLWSFMWGNGERDGYLAGLSQEEQDVARKILYDHDDLPVTLAAVDDAWWHVWDNDLEVTHLRSAWRHFLESNMWEPTTEVIRRAANAAIRCEGNIDQLFDDLYSLAAHVEEGELTRSFAACLGVSAMQIREVRETVMRSGVRTDCVMFRVDGLEVTPELAGRALALWHQLEPDADYLRLQTDQATAVVDLKANDGFFFDRVSGLDVPLGLGERNVPRWEQRLEVLLDAS